MHTGPCYVDVAAFLVELSVLKLGHPWFDTERGRRYTETFLRGYFPGQPPQLLGLFIVEALMKKWMRRRRTWSRTTIASTLADVRAPHRREIARRALVSRPVVLRAHPGVP